MAVSYTHSYILYTLFCMYYTYVDCLYFYIKALLCVCIYGFFTESYSSKNTSHGAVLKTVPVSNSL